MSRYGITLNLQETSEVLGNATGGAKTGVEYDGLTVGDLQIDTQRALGLHGGTFNISALQIHGRNLSSENLLTPPNLKRHRGRPRYPALGDVVSAELH